MSKRQLLREFIPISTGSSLVKESRDSNGGRLILRGVIQRAEAKNQNNRIYPRKILEREIDSYMKAVRENRAYGELDHPDTSTVALSNVSHIVREMDWNGDDVIGAVEVLNTPKGKILETLVDSGLTIGISSRGVGSTSKNESGCDIVQDDFSLVAFDMVSEPSTIGAYLREGVDFESRDLARPDRVFRAINNILSRKGKL